MDRRLMGGGALCLALALLLLWESVGGRGQERSGGDTEATPADLEPLRSPETEPPPEVPSVSPSRAEEALRLEVDPSPRAPRTLARIRGRLVIQGSGEPLERSLSVCLHTGNPRYVESLQTAEDGTFESSSEFPRGVVLALVRYPSGDLAVDSEYGFDPAEDVLWNVPVPWSTFAHGKLVDLRGQALEGIELRASFLQDARRMTQGRTRAEGEFTLSNLEPGLMGLVVTSQFETRKLPLAIERGPNELGELRVDLSAPAGDIRGRLLAPDGEPRGTLFLSDRSRDFLVACDVDSRKTADGVEEFAFERVPAGVYELRFVSRDGRRYQPSMLTVSPPADEIEFAAVGTAEVLHITAVHGAEELESHALLRVQGRWIEDHDEGYALYAVEAWAVGAPGYRPASGGKPETGELHVPLEPGFGWLVLFHEDQGRSEDGGIRNHPLKGAEVLLDGQVVATSDATGLALVDQQQGSNAVDFRLPGFTVWKQIRRVPVVFLSLKRD